MKKHLILLPAALIFAASCSGTSGDIPTYTESEFPDFDSLKTP